MPDGASPVPISVRLPADVVERLDKIASLMERPRSWVILDAVRCYLADEGQEVLDVQAGLDEIERGESTSFEQLIAKWEQKIAEAKLRHVSRQAPRIPLEEMFRGKSPTEWRKAYAGAYDWGPDIGREAVEE